jgi:hypothetical protein
MNLTTFGYHLKPGRQFRLEILSSPGQGVYLLARHVGFTTGFVVYKPKDQSDPDSARAMCEKQKPKFQKVIDAKGCTWVNNQRGLG